MRQLELNRQKQEELATSSLHRKDSDISGSVQSGGVDDGKSELTNNNNNNNKMDMDMVMVMDMDKVMSMIIQNIIMMIVHQIMKLQDCKRMKL